MKTKLLKRLRKDAKMQYKIKRIDGKYYIYEKSSIDIDGFSYLYLSNSSIPHKCLKDSKNRCNMLRRNYILCKIKCLREKKTYLYIFKSKIYNFL